MKLVYSIKITCIFPSKSPNEHYNDQNPPFVSTALAHTDTMLKPKAVTIKVVTMKATFMYSTDATGNRSIR